MRIRGRRRCKECGSRWSYFDAGEIACPDCGSLRSVGVDGERSLHTDTAVDLDLAEARQLVDHRPLGDVAAAAADAARGYVVRRGFIGGGELRPLSERYRLAAELRQVGDVLRHRRDPNADAETYFLTLLEADSVPGSPPPSLERAHGLAAVSAVEAYVADLRKWLASHPDQAGSDCLERLRDHVRRVNALDGEIPPKQAARLVEAARRLGAYLGPGEADDLEAARRALDRLG